MPTPTPEEIVAHRPSARVVLLDESGRLLLFSARDHKDDSMRWFTAGGGLESGESYEQAALRELREETGLVDVDLGPQIWQGRPWRTVREGVTYEVTQRYFLARVPAFEVDTSAFQEVEKAAITGYRWWSVEELEKTSDLLRPAGLPALLKALLTDGPPSEPVLVDG
ncbi:NUDIX hydrolase [Streptomyces spongiae]|uniref:NUDIX hydrolase n=1 Tax=Streptomyces spongiae TaxID=565072 RepID=UPI002AD25631|nr:NUDIX domain-containing protein [Streptomyces spongiae]